MTMKMSSYCPCSYGTMVKGTVVELTAGSHCSGGLAFAGVGICLGLGVCVFSSFFHPSPFTFLRLYFSLKEQIEAKNCFPCCPGNSSLMQSPTVHLFNRTSAPPPPPACDVMPAVNFRLRKDHDLPFQLPFRSFLVLLYY